MPILYCTLELYLPYCHSLKEKRRVIKSASDRLRSRFKFAISEMDHQDTWQRSRLAAVTVGPDRRLLAQLGDRFRDECDRLLAGEIVDFSAEIIEFD